MSTRMHLCRKKIIVLLAAFTMLSGNGLLAANTEDRLTALEQRLARLEANLEQLLQTISKNGPTDGLEQTKTEAQHLAQEIQSTKADSAPVQAALTALQPNRSQIKGETSGGRSHWLQEELLFASRGRELKTSEKGNPLAIRRRSRLRSSPRRVLL